MGVEWAVRRHKSMCRESSGMGHSSPSTVVLRIRDTWKKISAKSVSTWFQVCFGAALRVLWWLLGTQHPPSGPGGVQENMRACLGSPTFSFSDWWPLTWHVP